MNFSAIFYILGNLLLLLALILFVPAMIAGYFFQISASYEQFLHSEFFAFSISILLAILTGVLCKYLFHYDSRSEIGVREGFAIVTLGWLSLSFFGALPFYISQSCPTMIDAYFETMSGFTTTGATVISNIEGLAPGVLFWRSLTHWIGGMGIVALSVAILPLLGAGGYQLFRAEVPGPTTDRLTPRIAETAKKLWLVYILLTLIETILLMCGGMPLYDSLCHAFGTLATGGFATKNASIGHYDSAYFDWVITFFMFLAGCNFVLHYHLFFRGNWKTFFHSAELKVYIAILLIATLGISGILVAHSDDLSIYEPVSDANHDYGNFFGSLRYTAFQVVGVVTTTGFATANFDAWPDSARWILFMLMFCGGCAGSTSGGMKIIRLMVLAKAALREIYRLIHPHEIVQVKISGTTISPQVISNIVGFSILFMGLFGFFSLVMTFCGMDLVTSFSSVAATLGNIGPGLAKVGAYENYAWVSAPGKVVLTFCMLLGRLEIYSVMVLFLPGLWQRY